MAPRWTNLVRHGLLPATLLGLAARSAAADACYAEDERTLAVVLGVQVSPNVRFIGGIEGRQCVAYNTEAMLRFELGGGSPRVIAGARVLPFQDSHNNTDQELLGAEAGLALDWDGRLDAHLAASYGQPFFYTAVQGRLALTGPDRPAHVGLVGAIWPWAAARATVVEGRPLIANARYMRPEVVGRLPVPRSAEDRAVLAHFVSSAQLEYSSVWTFLRLAAELAAVGAPRDLIVRALDAADDEIRHAELCAIAAGGIALAPLPGASATPRFASRSSHALAVLAAEAWLEGCLNEGIAAEQARLVSGEASGPVAAMLGRIASDETRHAELSWAVLAWLFSIAPEATVGVLAELPRSAAMDDGHDDAALARRGVPSRSVTAAARAQVEAAARSRLAALAA